MNTHTEKSPDNKNQSAAGKSSRKRSNNRSSVNFEDHRPESDQLRDIKEMADNSNGHSQTIQNKPNNTGLPDNLKSGIENLSGFAMDDVKVHYNSSRPASLNAHAYAQGTDVHLAPGQEKHLPHEAWHIVQQKQGRVKPTLQMKGKVNINDDPGLEKEADKMGGKADRYIQFTRKGPYSRKLNIGSFSGKFHSSPLQRITFERTATGVIGEKLGRPDTDADNWIASFNQLQHLVNIQFQPHAATLVHFPGFNAGYTLPRAFVLANAALHIARQNRQATGQQIQTHLHNAQILHPRVAQIVGLGANAPLVAGFDVAKWNIFDNLVQLPATLARFGALAAADFTDFFNLPIAALNDFITIPNPRKTAILANIPRMTQVGGLDHAYNDYNGNLKQGHTFSEHGAHHSEAAMQALADAGGNPKGRWMNFNVQQNAITQADNHMWNVATYGANPLESAFRAPGWAWIHPGGVYDGVRHANTRANPNFPRTKKKVDLVNQNFLGGITGKTYWPMPAKSFWNLWMPSRPAPSVVGRYTAIFQLQQGGGAYHVLTAYPVL